MGAFTKVAKTAYFRKVRKSGRLCPCVRVSTRPSLDGFEVQNITKKVTDG